MFRIMTMTTRYASIIFSALLALSASADDGPRGKIKKCQDADGKWHYGDIAAQECEKSKVIEMTEKGFQARVIDAPATEQELVERKQAEKRAQQEAIQKKKDEVLLATYAHEDDIVYLRDRKLRTIATNIKASEETLVPLRAALARIEKQAAEELKGGKSITPETTQYIRRTKDQIARHEAVIEDKRKESEILSNNYDKDLVRYRILKKQQLSKTAN